MDGVCPLIFDSDIVPLLPVFLYTPTDDAEALLDSCYFKFGKLFLSEFGKGNLPLEDVVTFLEMFSTESEDISAVRSKFSLISHPWVLDKYDLLVPIMKFDTMKVKGATALCTEKFPAEPVTNYGSKKDKLHVFNNNADEVFKHSCWTQWKANTSEIKELSREEEFVRIIVVGNDATMASFLVSHFAKQVTDQEFAKMKFIVHFVPSEVGGCKISEFLSSFDDVYSKFVAPLCYTCTTMAPVIVERGGVPLMPAIDDSRVESFEPNLFFSYPSPMHMFKCGLHHYMRFADETVAVPIWECKLEYANGKNVIIPFITDVVFDVRSSCKVLYKTITGKDVTMEIKKRRITFIGLCKEYRPSEIECLQMIDDDRPQGPIISAELKSQKSSPIAIDGRNYGMPKKVALRLPRDSRQIEFATFVSYHV